MTKNTKRDILYITFAVLLFALIINLKLIFSLLGRLFNLCLPLIIGLIFALILNAPMRGYEKVFDKVFQKAKKQPSLKCKYSVSLIMSVISILLVLIIVFTMAIPKIVDSAVSLFRMIDDKLPKILILAEKYGFNTTDITDRLAEFDSEQVVKNITQGALSVFSTAVDATKVAIKFFSTTFFALIIAIYLLIDKNNISRQFKNLIYTVFPSKQADYFYKTAYLIRDTFSNFLTGQCLEAVLLALLIFTLFSVFSLPYASLVAILAAVLSFIPYFGSFIACVVGTFLTLIIAPKKALLCLAVYLAAQLIEQHFIYPHVVGTSVGLSPFYTIVAVLLGGKLFGVFGMVFFIPIFSVLLVIIRDFCTSRKSEKYRYNCTRKTN